LLARVKNFSVFQAAGILKKIRMGVKQLDSSLKKSNGAEEHKFQSIRSNINIPSLP